MVDGHAHLKYVSTVYVLQPAIFPGKLNQILFQCFSRAYSQQELIKRASLMNHDDYVIAVLASEMVAEHYKRGWTV
jgi:hypothetical protein